MKCKDKQKKYIFKKSETQSAFRIPTNGGVPCSSMDFSSGPT